MTGRREFLKAAGGAGLLGRSRKELTGGRIPDGRSSLCVTRAREVVRRGELGAIHFCRVADPGLCATASYILDQAECVIDVEPGAEGVAFLGSRGTLAMAGDGWRVFGQEKVKSQK